MRSGTWHPKPSLCSSICIAWSKPLPCAYLSCKGGEFCMDCGVLLHQDLLPHTFGAGKVVWSCHQGILACTSWGCPGILWLSCTSYQEDRLSSAKIHLGDLNLAAEQYFPATEALNLIWQPLGRACEGLALPMSCILLGWAGWRSPSTARPLLCAVTFP